MRTGLPASLLQGQASFARAVEAAQGHIGPPRLLLDLKRRTIIAHGKEVALPPAELAFLAWFARRSKQGLAALARPSDGVPEPAYAREYLTEYQRIVGTMGMHDRVRNRLAQGMSRADFDERKSRLKTLLQNALGAAAQPYLVQGTGRRPQRFCLPLPPEAIHFET